MMTPIFSKAQTLYFRIRYCQRQRWQCEEENSCIIPSGQFQRPEELNRSSQSQIDPAFEYAPVIKAEDAFVLPSLAEMHIHGCASWGFERISEPGDLFQIAALLEAKGVGCYVPTILWEERTLIELTETILASGISAPLLPGIYLEGPFVNLSKRGGIIPDNIRAPDIALAEHILDISKGLLKICTMAPELDGIDQIYPVFQNKAVLVSLGHSDAKLSSIHPPSRPFPSLTYSMR